MSLSSQQRLNNHLIRWDAEVKAFQAALQDYGAHKAALEHKRAVLRATARAEDPKISGVKLDDLVDADEPVFDLHVSYRSAEGTVEAMRARLRWFQAVSDALRSEVSTERAERALHADHGPGA